jgi:hypothetical protein
MEKYLKAYFLIQSDYYFEKYKSYKSGDKIIFNVWPFLFGIFWFLYRKLWLEAFVILLLYLIIYTLNTGIAEPDNEWLVNSLFNIIIATGLGFSGNYFYLKNAEKKVQSVLSTISDEKQRVRVLSKKGGVSLAPYFLLFVFLSIMVVLNAIQH